MHPDLHEFFADIAAPLGGYYAVAAAMNVAAAWRAFRGEGRGAVRGRVCMRTG